MPARRKSKATQSDAAAAPAAPEPAAPAVVGGGNKHRAQLEALRERDPNFYKHLLENDPDLLAFNDSDSDMSSDSAEDRPSESEDGEDSDKDEVDLAAGLEDLSDSEAESSDEEDALDSESDEAGEDAQDEDVPELTMEQWDSLCDAAWRTGTSVRALQQALQVFRVAVSQHAADDSDQHHTDPVRIGGAGMWSTVVADTLAGVRLALAAHLKGGVSDTGPVPLTQLRSAPGWKKMRPLVQSFCVNLLALLTAPAPAATLLNLLRGLALYLPLYAAFPKLQRRLLKRLLSVLGGTSAAGHGITDAGEQSKSASGGRAGKKRGRQAESGYDPDASADSPAVMSVRAQAFLRLRQAALELPYPAIDSVLKGVYLAYVRASKFVSAATLPRMTLLGNAVVEIAGLDREVAYQHGFVYLRQLALHLRAALVSRDSKSTAAVLCWQWLACMRAWTAVLACHGNDPASPLWQLTYPLCQLAMGVLPLLESPALAPMRLHVLKAVNDVAWACGTYCPIGPALLHMLTAPAWAKRATGTGKPPTLVTALRLSASELDAAATRDVLVTATLELLHDHLRAHSASPAFPELYAALAPTLRRWSKGCKNSAWRDRAQAVLTWAGPVAEHSAAARAEAGIAPADMGAVASWQHAEHTKARASRLKLLSPQPVQAIVHAAEAAQAEQADEPAGTVAVSKASRKMKRKRGSGARGSAAVAEAAAAAPDAVQALDLGAF